jgi:hypothetical protein
VPFVAVQRDVIVACFFSVLVLQAELLDDAKKQSNAPIREISMTEKMNRDGRFLSRFRANNVHVHK